MATPRRALTVGNRATMWKVASPPARPVTTAFAPLAVAPADAHAGGMFTVTDAQAAAIRRVFVEQGELPAVIELRRHFPGITDPAKARECARFIAGWRPSPAMPGLVRRLRSAGSDGAASG